MDNKKYFFERNLLALSRIDGELCTRLSVALTSGRCYKFLESRSGTVVPAYVDSSGAARPLHSLIAPEKEAGRLMAGSINNEKYIIIFGLGAPYTINAALKNCDIQHLLIIDFNINSIAELLSCFDYVEPFNDIRLYILIDPDDTEIVAHILNTYNPCLHDGIRTIPLRARCDFDREHFIPAGESVKRAIDKISADYSVQAYFGKRWFSNIIHNVFTAETQTGIFPPVRRAAICAAGPSLDTQLNLITAKRDSLFIIATDTSLGALLNAQIKPDAIISIDCQHISYYHFVGKNIRDIPLFLDLASPPLLSTLSDKFFFFSGGHPLNGFITKAFRELPCIDTSGGNVTYAALSLAEKLGAKEIEVYGADFSYPQGKVYSGGAYFYPFFNRRQNRLKTEENSICSFLYNSPSLKRVRKTDSWYYETRALSMYRKNFEEKSGLSKAKIIPQEGGGAPISIKASNDSALSFNTFNTFNLFSSGPVKISAKDFLAEYRNNILSLPKPDGGSCSYYVKLSALQKMVLTTMLPTACAIKFKNNQQFSTLIETVKDFCACKIDRLISKDNLVYYI
ncbi:hypothetical protein FACS1894190_01170 [Spirochaetia bacterium]|nr:hypothetical protein FACS1894190_01170 [Spirochaetia bacterium]